MRNTWAICLEVVDNIPNGVLIPDVFDEGHPLSSKDGAQALSLQDEPAAY